MTSPKLATLEERDAERIANDVAQLKATPLLPEIINALPSITFVVNSRREVILGNEALEKALGQGTLDEALGARHGDLLGCANAICSEGGCGSTQACRVCGAINAIRESQQQKTRIEHECRLSIRGPQGFESREFLVSATPLNIGERSDLTIVSLLDISDEKRRRTLERIFFHDVVNSAVGVLGLAQHAGEATEPDEREELLDQLQGLTEQLVDEIQAQRDLLAAESNDLAVNPRPVSALKVLQEALVLVQNQQAGAGKTLIIGPSTPDVKITTDRRLLNRVLVNLLKNAAEATPDGGVVSATLSEEGEHIEYAIHNPGCIEEDAQLQIFQRAFSTKGEGRGIGTYSVKLLTERYLKGRVTFTSSEAEGTTFRVKYPKEL